MDSQWGPETFDPKIPINVFFRIIRIKWFVLATNEESGPSCIPRHGGGNA